MAFETRRAREHLARLSLVGLVVAAVVAGIGGLEAGADRLIATGASRIVEDAEPAARTVRVVALEASDADAQDAEILDAIATSFGEAEIVVSRQAELEVAAETPAGGAYTLGLLDDARVPDLAVLTGGEWPRIPDAFALSDAAAERLGLAIGDAVRLPNAGTTLALVGTWVATDPLDPAWHGDPAVASGVSDDVIGPAIIAAGALPGEAGTPRITWEIAPVRHGLAGIPALERGLASLGGLPDAVDPQRQHSTRVIGDLGDTLHRQAAAVAATRGLLTAPLSIIAILGTLVLGVVLSTLSIARRDELALLRARGASGRRLALDAAAEAALVAASGAVLALAALAASTGMTASAPLTAAGAVVFAAATASILAIRNASSSPGGATRRSDAGVRSLLSLLLPAGIAVGVAALSAWQLVATGVVVRADGTPDPVATAAPALLLIASCALAPIAAAPLAALTERILRHTRGISPVLPLRQVARRTGTVAVSILCLALASASAALALAAPAAAAHADQLSRTALLGADVRVIADGPGTAAAAATEWSEVTSATEVLHTSLTVGSDTAALVAGPPAALGLSARSRPGEDGTLDAAITRSLADRLGAGDGTVFTARIRSIARPVPFRIAQVVDDLPGVGDGWGVAVDPDELRLAGVDLAPNELWIRTDAPAEVAARLRANSTQPVRILTAEQVSAAPVTSLAPMLLSSAAIVTAVLGLVGFVAASSAANRVRAAESYVLRALGLPPGRQRSLRIGEVTGVAVYSVLAGAALGAAVAAAVLPIILRAGV